MAYTYERLDGCHFFGIWPEYIERACTTCEDVLKTYDLENFIDDLYEGAEETLKCYYIGKYDHLSNTICNALFNELAFILRQRRKDLDVDYFVNGDDTHFYINGEEV